MSAGAHHTFFDTEAEQMLDAVVIFTELFRALWHGPCGSAEISTNFYSREKIAISTLPPDKHDGWQKWIAADDTTMKKGA